MRMYVDQTPKHPYDYCPFANYDNGGYSCTLNKGYPCNIEIHGTCDCLQVLNVKEIFSSKGGADSWR